MISVLTILYCTCALLLTLYGINCHLMTWLFYRYRDIRKIEDQRILEDFFGSHVPEEGLEWAHRLPVVTTQLPVYNEQNVVERLLDAVAAFHYPPGRHEIQVLDDSTDNTSNIIAAKVAALRRQGIDIQHIQRRHRIGFKAGALREGLFSARGEFLAIFDADFLPPPDFLLRAMPFFLENQKLGFVQGRWDHINRTENMITRLQAIGINGHFMIEQSARSGAGLFLNFNGTAGIFRKAAVLDAGNWQDDTLTEDMDLS
jgi:cellulose synthase/poly-beta-1,6-N-acetylglucosamine synthase-like glycosyltransferase